jgi:hypothetical protein
MTPGEILLASLIVILLLVISALLLVMVRNLRKKTVPDNAVAVSPDPDSPFRFRHHQGDPLSDQICRAVNLMGAAGDDAEARYRESVALLHPQAGEAARIASDEYRDLPPERYLDRWSLIYLLAELRHPAALPLLDAVLSEEIPPGQPGDPDLTAMGEECMIRTTAIEALTRMSADGNGEARDILLKYCRSPLFPVRRASVQGYLATAGEGARETLLRAIPKDLQAVLMIERRDVHEIPQPHGERHLTGKEADFPPRTGPEVIRGEE